jgi:hypothetical protein
VATRLYWTVLAVAACGRIRFEDRAATGDAAPASVPDAAGTCDPAAPFGTPVELTSLDPDDGIEGTLRLLPDELTGYYWSSRGRGSNGKTFLYRVTRADLASPFAAAPVTSLNDVAAGVNELDPSPAADDTLLLFRRSGTGFGDEIFMALGSGGAYGSGALVAALHSNSGETQPFIQLGGDEVWFQSLRSGSGDLYRATRTGSAFSGVMLVSEVSDGSAEDGDPVITPDGLTLYFRSDRPGIGSGFNVWTASRASTGDAFGAPVELAGVNSDLNEGPSWISPDGCRLYVSSDRSGTNEVYVATRGAP